MTTHQDSLETTVKPALMNLQVSDFSTVVYVRMEETATTASGWVVDSKRHTETWMSLVFQRLLTMKQHAKTLL